LKFLGIIPLIVLIIFSYNNVKFADLKNNFNHKNTMVFDGYLNKEESIDNNRIKGYSDLYKYYYSPNDDKKFEESSEYESVSQNREKVENYFNSTLDYIDCMNRNNIDFFDLKSDDISDDDYFHIYEKDKASDLKTSLSYFFYYYDVQKHILYVAKFVD